MSLSSEAYVPGEEYLFTATFEVVLDEGRTLLDTHNFRRLAKQNSHWQKNNSFAYRLSVVGSVAPPGTAWDAEGLRGNEANENNLIVLARRLARKWQNCGGFAQGSLWGELGAEWPDANN